jgi:hypothetical protein
MSVRRFGIVVVVLVPLLLLPPLWLVAPRLTRVPLSPVRTVPTLLPLEPVVLRFTCGVVVMRLLELEVLRFTCGLTALRLLLELEVLRLTCGVAELLRLMLELEVLRLTVGAVEWLERETAADWLLLLVLPPCERLRPWAEASDALKIRHPMRAKLIMIRVTEVFIIVLFYNVQQVI